MQVEFSKIIEKSSAIHPDSKKYCDGLQCQTHHDFTRNGNVEPSQARVALLSRPYSDLQGKRQYL